jgi:hypothetical protein
MRKKMLFLALALATTASLTAPRAQAGPLGGGPYHSCPVCTTYSDGSQCCITCQCNDSGVMLCPMIGCAPVSEL